MSNKRAIIKGRFQKSVDKNALSLGASHEIDRSLYEYDIQGSIAHATMLAKVNIITAKEKQLIIRSLKQIKQEIKENKFSFSDALEDIHMHIESRLTELAGDAGKKLHTGRSRNDQVILDFTMYCREASLDLTLHLKELLKVLVEKAVEHQKIFMPAYTHLQQAQVIRCAHHFLAYANKFHRDILRLQDSFKRMDEMPLGAGALVGTGLNNDRDLVAKLLGFKKITSNSMDTVSNRDFALEHLFNISLIALHLSRFCEEIVIWFSSEFDYIELDETWCTGSSLMPQKSNPDMAELIRGKTGRFIGNLINLYTTVKALPLTYNRDLQEDKESVFDSQNQIKECLQVFTGMLSSLRFKDDILDRQKDDYMLATDIAEYLVKKDIPFREAHDITGQMVRYAIKNKQLLKEIGLNKLKSFSSCFEDDIKNILNLKKSPDFKNTKGSTSIKEIKKQVKEWKKIIAQL